MHADGARVSQLHSPYTATPMSIASYRLSTSPSDRTKQTVVEWLDRMQSSVESNLRLHTGDSFNFDMRGTADGDSEDEDGASRHDGTERGTPLAEEELDGDAAAQLPDASVPIGLLAKMSLYSNSDNEKKRRQKKPAAAGAAADSDSSDGDVVRIASLHPVTDRVSLPFFFQGVANPTYFTPGAVCALYSLI